MYASSSSMASTLQSPKTPRPSGCSIRTLHATAACPSRRRRHMRCRASLDDEGSSLPEALPVFQGSDWRAFRASLVQRERQAAGAEAPEAWAHVLPRPEQGCLLLAHPLFFAASQTYFRDAVILLFAHSPSGSAGIILNRCTDYTCAEAVGETEQMQELADNPLYLGGDVGKSTLHLLHGVSGLEQSVEVVPGVWLGGWEGAKAQIRDGSAQPSAFRVYWQYAGWGPGQLEDECERGVWFPAAASKEVFLSQGPFAGVSGSDAWHKVMTLMGGEHAELSKALNQTLPGLNTSSRKAETTDDGSRETADAEQQQDEPTEGGAGI